MDSQHATVRPNRLVAGGGQHARLRWRASRQRCFLFTRNGKAAREFKHRIQCGMVGINIGVPASMAWFPFNGWNGSLFGDLHMQGKEGVQFFTQLKVTTSRWFSYGEGDIWHREAKS